MSVDNGNAGPNDPEEAQKMQEELQPIAAELAAESARASETAATFEARAAGTAPRKGRR